MHEVCVDTARIGGIEMPFARFGGGAKSFVILPGVSLKPVTENAAAVAAAYAPLQADYTVYLLDRRTDLPPDTTVQTLAADTVTVLRHLGVEKADFFGVSQGGMMALCMALDFPKIVHSVVVGSASCRCTPQFLHLIEQWEVLAKNRDETALIKSFSQSLFSPATLRSAGAMIEQSLRGATARDYDRFVAQLDACRNFSVADKLQNISCPCFVLAAAGDRVFGLSQAAEIVEKTHGAHFFYGAEYGHAVYDEAPDYLTRILGFLKKQP